MGSEMCIRDRTWPMRLIALGPKQPECPTQINCGIACCTYLNSSLHFFQDLRRCRSHLLSHIWVSMGQQCPSPEPRSLRFLPNTSFAARGFAPIQLSKQNGGRTAPSMLMLPPQLMRIGALDAMFVVRVHAMHPQRRLTAPRLPTSFTHRSYS